MSAVARFPSEAVILNHLRNHPFTNTTDQLTCCVGNQTILEAVAKFFANQKTYVPQLGLSNKHEFVKSSMPLLMYHIQETHGLPRSALVALSLNLTEAMTSVEEI